MISSNFISKLQNNSSVTPYDIIIVNKGKFMKIVTSDFLFGVSSSLIIVLFGCRIKVTVDGTKGLFSEGNCTELKSRDARAADLNGQTPRKTTGLRLFASNIQNALPALGMRKSCSALAFFIGCLPTCAVCSPQPHDQWTIYAFFWSFWSQCLYSKTMCKHQLAKPHPMY